MYLQLLLRNCRNRKTECAILVPFAYWWQEGPNDINIQFDSIGTQNYHPKLNENGDYLLPNPQDATQNSIAYQIGIIPTLPENHEHHFIANAAYIKRLKNLWS